MRDRRFTKRTTCFESLAKSVVAIAARWPSGRSSAQVPANPMRALRGPTGSSVLSSSCDSLAPSSARTSPTSSFACRSGPCRTSGRAASRPGTRNTTASAATPSGPRIARIDPKYTAGLLEGPLLDRDGLRQVPRLDDVQAAEARDSVGEQLERQYGERGLEEGGSPRHVDHVVGVVLDVLVPVGRDRDHVRAARS